MNNEGGIRIAPSVLSADLARLKEQVAHVPQEDGDLFFGEGYTGNLHRMPLPGPDEQIVGRFEGGITDVAVGPDGALWVVTPNVLYRRAPAQATSPTSPTETSPTATGSPSESPTPSASASPSGQAGSTGS